MRNFWKANHKYKAQRVELDGRSFASKLEASLYGHLKLLALAHEIKIINAQDHIDLSAARIGYIPDFKVINLCAGSYGRYEWHEAKGFETPEWRIKKKLWKAYGPGPLHIWMGRPNSIKCVETVVPMLREERIRIENELDSIPTID